MLLTSAALDAAAQQARDQARAAGVIVRKLNTDEAAEACSLLADIWEIDSGHGPLEPTLLIALLHCDNYVAGAFADDRMVGVCVGFFSAPLGTGMHSHLAGVIGEHTGRGIGAALKFHQRAWALQRGVEAITWTYDPLVARNAFFNLHVLGAEVAEYVPDFYGEMTDSVNSGQTTDRIVVRWSLDDTTSAEPVAQRDAGREFVLLDRDHAHAPVLTGPPPGEISWCRVAVPENITQLRTHDRELAIQWRRAVREAFLALPLEQWAVRDFHRSGYYLLERT